MNAIKKFLDYSLAASFIIAVFFALTQEAAASVIGGYELYFGDVPIGNYDTLSEACAAVNNDSSGNRYTIFLSDTDISMGAAATIAANKTVTLTGIGPGNVITQTNPRTRHIFVNGSLILNNITLDGNNTGGGIEVANGMLEMNEGAVITKCATATGGCGISLSDGELTMNGGEISDNHQSTQFGGSGGGIYMDNSIFTMNDGIITKNSAVWGGGVRVGVESTFTMNGGEISYNKATVEYGGGVHIYAHGTFILNNGTIAGNTVAGSGKMGGGVFVGQGSYPDTDPNDWAKFFMNGGSVEQNSATYGGGVASSWIGNIEMADGTIAGNSAIAGGGVFLTNSRDADNRVSFVMTGGEISGNEATGNGTYGGGGIYANTVGRTYSIKVVIGDSAGASPDVPLVYGNSADHAGGIFLLGPKTQATIHDGRIYKNTANYGGGIAVSSGSVLNIHGGVIGGEDDGEGNTALHNGGGIYVSSSGSIVAAGATSFKNNSAVNEGGGIYTEKYTGYTGGIPGDYSGVQAGDYANITTDSDTVFSGNTASAAYGPPTNANVTFANIGYAVSSIRGNGGYLNPINNYDINYVGSPWAAEVTVIYDANGGTGGHTVAGLAPGSQHTVLTLAATGIARSGYSFVGWNTALNGTGDALAPGETIMPSGNLTLYAQWRIEDISVPGTPNPAGPDIYMPDSTRPSPEAPETSSPTTEIPGSEIPKTGYMGPETSLRFFSVLLLCSGAVCIFGKKKN